MMHGEIGVGAWQVMARRSGSRPISEAIGAKTGNEADVTTWSHHRALIASGTVMHREILQRQLQAWSFVTDSRETPRRCRRCASPPRRATVMTWCCSICR
jgi:hypothetical protein